MNSSRTECLQAQWTNIGAHTVARDRQRERGRTSESHRRMEASVIPSEHDYLCLSIGHLLLAQHHVPVRGLGGRAQDFVPDASTSNTSLPPSPHTCRPCQTALCSGTIPHPEPSPALETLRIHVVYSAIANECLSTPNDGTSFRPERLQRSRYTASFAATIRGRVASRTRPSPQAPPSQTAQHAATWRGGASASVSCHNHLRCYRRGQHQRVEDETEDGGVGAPQPMPRHAHDASALGREHWPGHSAEPLTLRILTTASSNTFATRAAHQPTAARRSLQHFRVNTLDCNQKRGGVRELPRVNCPDSPPAAVHSII